MHTPEDTLRPSPPSDRIRHANLYPLLPSPPHIAHLPLPSPSPPLPLPSPPPLSPPFPPPSPPPPPPSPPQPPTALSRPLTPSPPSSDRARTWHLKRHESPQRRPPHSPHPTPPPHRHPPALLDAGRASHPPPSAEGVAPPPSPPPPKLIPHPHPTPTPTTAPPTGRRQAKTRGSVNRLRPALRQLRHHLTATPPRLGHHQPKPRPPTLRDCSPRAPPSTPELLTTPTPATRLSGSPLAAPTVAPGSNPAQSSRARRVAPRRTPPILVLWWSSAASRQRPSSRPRSPEVVPGPRRRPRRGSRRRPGRAEVPGGFAPEGSRQPPGLVGQQARGLPEPSRSRTTSARTRCPPGRARASAALGASRTWTRRRRCGRGPRADGGGVRGDGPRRASGRPDLRRRPARGLRRRARPRPAGRGRLGRCGD